MRLGFIIFFSSFFILLNGQTFSQEAKAKRGDKLYEAYSYSEAISVYENVSPKSISLLRNLGTSYLKLDSLNKAKSCFNEIVKSKEVEANDIYVLSEILKSFEQYDSSSFWMDKYYNLNPNDYRASLHKKDSVGVEALLTDNYRFEIKNMEINSAEQDFGVSYYKNEIVFSSARKKIEPIERTWNGNGQPFLSMYRTSVNDSGEFENIEPFHQKLNLKYHQGPAAFTKDGDKIIYTRNIQNSKAEDGVTRFKLFEAEITDNDWSQEFELKANGLNYSVGHPSLTSNGDTLYFSSDMPNGIGGADLYFLTKDSTGNWSESYNLGKGINTEGDEMFPFIHESGVLYFASNGRPGLGGLDLYKTNLRDINSNEIINLGSPFNSSSSDFSIVIDSSNSTGYFASDRPGGKGSDDIYSFSISKKQFKNCINRPCVTLDLRNEGEVREYHMKYLWNMGDGSIIHGPIISHCYEKPGKYIAQLSIEDKISGTFEQNIESIEIEIDSVEGSFAEIVSENEAALDSAVIFDGGKSFSSKGKILSYDWDFGDGEKARDEIEVNHTYKETGKYDVMLRVVVENEDKSICSDTAFRSVYIHEPPKVVENQQVQEIPYDEEYKINGVFGDRNLSLYELEITVIQRGSEKIASLAKVNIETVTGELWYSLFTDSLGKLEVLLDPNEEYELRATHTNLGLGTLTHLTQNRTEKEYSKAIIEISKDEYSFVGNVFDYETKELVKDVSIDFASLDSNRKSFNCISSNGRFEEFIEEAKKGDIINYQITISKAGYFTTQRNIHLKLDTLKQINIFEILEFKFTEVKLGADISGIVGLRPIYFDLGKSDITELAAIELDKVASFMTLNPSIIIELGSHSDSRGGKDFNLKLSDKRAKSSSDYIQKQGVGDNRIFGVGYGESQLLNKCADGVPCTKEEHQENRRTEFKIVKIL